MVITTLMDNHAMPGTGLAAEHGFSCLIETDAARILFDTGATDAFIGNAEATGADLSDIDHLVISHGHYDHAGGVVPFLEKFRPPSLIMWTGKGFEDPKFVVGDDGRRHLGLDFNRSFVEKHQVVWRTVSVDTLMIAPGVWLVTGFDRIHPIEQSNPRFVVVREGKEEVDDFSDEVALVVDSPHGLVMVTGCSHPGILNMVDSVLSRFARPFYALVGGIHLFDASAERRDYVVKSLIDRNIPLLGISHCTGDEAEQYVAAHCPGYFENPSGTRTVID